MCVIIFLDILIPKNVQHISFIQCIYLCCIAFHYDLLEGEVSRISLICLGAMVPPLRTLGMTTDMIFDISVELAEKAMLIDQMSQ